jgi:transposase
MLVNWFGDQPMKTNLFCLNDQRWAKIKPPIPIRSGHKPPNNRRILSGIIHVLKTGGHWQEDGPVYDGA